MGNRMVKYFREEESSNRNRPQGDQEAFMVCPTTFHTGMTPAQFAAMQQIYQVAYERARAQIQASGEWWNDNDAGSGI